MRYITFRNIYYAGLSAVICLFASCSDDDLNSKELKAYVNTAKMNKVEVLIKHTPIESIGETTVKFPVRTTRELLANANIAFEVDNSLVETYNQANNTSFQATPANAYTFIRQAVDINEGEMISKDSIQLELKNLATLTDVNGYLLPLRLRQITCKDKGLEASSNMGVVYLIVNLSFENVAVSETALEGSLLGRTAWEAVASSTYNATYTVQNILDGKNNTSWFASGMNTPTITVDMKENATLKGFRLTPNYSAFGSAYNMAEIEVFISNNGLSWTSQGKVPLTRPATGSSYISPDFKYVKFHAPMNTRYFRFKVTAAYNNYAALAELEAYN